MIVTNNCQVSRKGRDDDEEQQRPPDPFFERRAVPKQYGAGHGRQDRKTVDPPRHGEGIEHFRALDHIYGQDDETNPIPPQQCQQYPARRHRSDPAPQGQQCGGDCHQCECQQEFSGTVHRLCVCGYSSAGAHQALTSSIEGALSPSLFFLLKPQRSLKNFPAGSLRSASTVR